MAGSVCVSRTQCGEWGRAGDIARKVGDILHGGGVGGGGGGGGTHGDWSRNTDGCAMGWRSYVHGARGAQTFAVRTKTGMTLGNFLRAGFVSRRLTDGRRGARAAESKCVIQVDAIGACAQSTVVTG